ncbi:MarR family winged helix-turn-helix transcriptional regulator [Pseudonocardia charpentierae]|uniref:MarR family transcriptional regulator n=1 Tax=Pseudonocardia charpentierae TaxID=3075545 RepID=A0ABU2N5N6_9PSEU|nr:MarR family transcriptional regulator [Pseudonocardia sp. DSM 45834]MDT0349252.1 MarR family transcriptional regulator [Pseudonocardia sp. DSM 45834]
MQEQEEWGRQESLSDSFRAVSRRLRIQSQKALAPWDVTPGQARALGVLSRHGPVRLGTLSEHLRIAARSATEVADALEMRGLVDRRADPTDRRATLIALTPRGEEVTTAIRAARGVEAEEFFARLDADDRAALARILDALLDQSSG